MGPGIKLVVAPRSSALLYSEQFGAEEWHDQINKKMSRPLCVFRWGRWLYFSALHSWDVLEVFCNVLLGGTGVVISLNN